MHEPDVSDRFGVLLGLYCRHCVPHRAHLARQVIADGLLVAVAESIKAVPGKTARRETCRDRLAQIAPLLPERWMVCLSPRMLVRGVDFAKCKVMESKKKPLLLFLQNDEAAADPILVIFKTGDDLRQDLMTLQMLRIMDALWLQQGLDLRMKPYGCCATGDETGMVEIVTNSETINTINSDYGGGLMGAFKTSTIRAFIEGSNSSSAQARDDAVENFVRTCAGYCVATFVMGIGDRELLAHGRVAAATAAAAAARRRPPPLPNRAQTIRTHAHTQPAPAHLLHRASVFRAQATPTTSW
jgi:hypothetical protein